MVPSPRKVEADLSTKLFSSARYGKSRFELLVFLFIFVLDCNTGTVNQTSVAASGYGNQMHLVRLQTAGCWNQARLAVASRSHNLGLSWFWLERALVVHIFVSHVVLFWNEFEMLAAMTSFFNLQLKLQQTQSTSSRKEIGTDETLENGRASTLPSCLDCERSRCSLKAFRASAWTLQVWGLLTY